MPRALAMLASTISIALAAPLAAQTPPTAPAGATLFQDHCAACHAGTDTRIPTVASLRQRSQQSILDALTSGPMRQQGESLSDGERRAIAAFLSTTTSNAAADPRVDTSCTTQTGFGPGSGEWRSWSPAADNSRFQSAPQAGLTAEQIPRLKLKWAFGFPNATSARGAPTLYGGRLFVGSQDGTVYALDAKSGCTYWSYKAKGAVRSAIVIDTPSSTTVAYFGDERANVYALNAATGQLLWTRPVEEHASSRVTGAPTPYQGRLYVPVSSLEEGQGNNAKYECCTFRGSLVALNASTGALVWKTFTIDDEPHQVGTNPGGSRRFGPAGAAIWSSPTVDRQRRLIYAATGNMYSEPQQPTSDSVIAFEMDTGKIRWVAQVTPKDVFVVGCAPIPAIAQPVTGANCPGAEGLGPDFDFGSSPMLVKRPDGREIIVIGQKSGIGWALDPDNRGAVIWQYRAGEGTALGGMEWGSAVDGEHAYFGVSDGNKPSAGELHAVQLNTGERAWRAMPRATLCGERARGCSPGILAALSVMPGAVFAGSLDGGIRAYSTRDGSMLWEFDTNREFTTVNGVTAKGASLNGPGPIIGGGMVYVNSGYGALGGRPGNVLLAFGLEE